MILGNGFVGTELFKQTGFDLLSRYDTIPTDINLCIVCAPTGNRLAVNQNPDKDLLDVADITSKVKLAKPAVSVLISTVDSLLDNKRPYTVNRCTLEQSYNWDFIARLPSLINDNLSKNLIYDLKHETWLHTHNLNTAMQWYVLDNLGNDLDHLISKGITEYNLVSEPIVNRLIVERFCPDLLPKLVDQSENIVQYNIHNNGEYHCSSDTILDSIELYLRK